MPRRSLSLARRLMADQLEQTDPFAFILERTFHLGTLARERLTSQPSIRWRTLFLKALGLVVERWPELRSRYCDGWRPRLEEFARPRIAVAIPRYLDAEPVRFLPVFDDPGRQGVAELDRMLDRLENAALETIPSYRAMLRHVAWPTLMRRWFARPPVPCVLAVPEENDSQATGILPGAVRFHIGPFGGDGRVGVTLCYDPRVLNACAADRVLADLEETLLHATLAETRYLRAAA